VLEAVVDGAPARVVVNVQPGHPGTYEASYRGQRHVFTPPDRLAGAAAVGDGAVTSPMPGTVLDVRVAVGDRVHAGDVLGVMEAMKMEHALTAPFDGILTEVDVVAGGQVALGATLFVVEEESS